MKSIKLASLYFLLAYIISTIISFAAYRIDSTAMWVSLLTLMPVIFGYLFYLYLKNTECDLISSLKETSLLIVFWIILSFLLDGFVYIIIVPLIFGHNPIWIFFAGQSPWIYFNYGIIIIAGYISRYIYIRRVK